MRIIIFLEELPLLSIQQDMKHNWVLRSQPSYFSIACAIASTMHKTLCCLCKILTIILQSGYHHFQDEKISKERKARIFAQVDLVPKSLLFFSLCDTSITLATTDRSLFCSIKHLGRTTKHIFFS